MAKPASGTYEPNKRVMLKVKHERECDCVVAGFRWHKRGEGTAVGSLLLGLYDDAGVAPARRRRRELHATRSARELVEFLAPYRADALDDHPWKDWAGAGRRERGGQRMPGAKSRWSQGKDLSWEPLRPELVVEVAYDHMQGTRFRHTAQFRRWRPDKRAARLHATRSSRWSRRTSWRRSSQRAAERSLRLRGRAARRSPRARGIVVGVGRLLRRAQRLRDVPQVDADARPGRRAPAHRVDEHVVDGELRGRLGMPRLPALEPRERRLLARRVRDHDQRHLRARPLAAPLRARRRDARRLALHLAEVRRPRRVAEARRLVARRELEQRLERAGGGVHAGVRIADARRSAPAPCAP